MLIDGSQAIYCKTYSEADKNLRRAQGNTLFISSSPRYVMEALGMLLISVLAYSLSQQVDGFASVIPILGTMALGAQRLLPALQQAYGSWIQINSGQASLQDTLDLLDQSLPNAADKPNALPLTFKYSISLKQLNFRYNEKGPYVFKGLNLTIPKGSSVGFIGTTGSGKSTLIDVVMGLLQPTNGNLEVDGQAITIANNRSWQAHVAHVPQAIFGG